MSAGKIMHEQIRHMLSEMNEDEIEDFIKPTPLSLKQAKRLIRNELTQEEKAHLFHSGDPFVFRDKPYIVCEACRGTGQEGRCPECNGAGAIKR